MNMRPIPDRANVFLDVETTTLDNNNAKGALSALTGRIVCVCTLRDDGSILTEQTFIGQDEAQLLRGFWQSLKPSDTLIGHNALNFDLTFIRQRSWILGIRPSRRVDLRRFYSQDVVDTMQVFSNWGTTKYPGLRPYNPQSLHKAIAKVLCKTFKGVKYNEEGLDSWSTHRLRHTMATRLVAAGLDAAAVMAVGRWDSFKNMCGYARVDHTVAARGYNEAMARAKSNLNSPSKRSSGFLQYVKKPLQDNKSM